MKDILLKAPSDRLPAAPASKALPSATMVLRVDTWVFDLDNTLYPADCDLWPKIDQRITLYLADIFGLDGLSSRALQKYYYERYGTTLRGLMEELGIGADDFLAFTHDIDRSSLLPNPSLASAITALPGRKLILTARANMPWRPPERLAWGQCSTIFSTLRMLISYQNLPLKPMSVSSNGMRLIRSGRLYSTILRETSSFHIKGG
jgi:hypothetical protein